MSDIENKIELSKGMVALVSVEDFDFLSQFNWYAKETKPAHRKSKAYATRDVNRKKVYMHRVIMERMREGRPIREGVIVDHINGNSLDNRRENLRVLCKRKNSKPFYDLNRQRRKLKQVRQKE